MFTGICSFNFWNCTLYFVKEFYFELIHRFVDTKKELSLYGITDKNRCFHCVQPDSVGLKLIDNSSRKMRTVKEVCIPRLNSLRFWQFYFSVYFLIFVSIEKMYQIIEAVFHRLSKHFANFVKNTSLRVVFSTLFSVFGYPDETLSPVFDILLHTFQNCSNEQLIFTIGCWIGSMSCITPQCHR